MISDDLFLMDRLPGRILLVGGGFIACEFATILAGLGVDTVQAYRGDAVLRGFDREARDLATLQLSAVGVDLRLGLTPAALERDGDGIRVRFDDGSDDRFDAVLMALGGEPVGPRYIDWNFVSSSKERIEQAREDWAAGRMKLPDLDDAEFIPLPPERPGVREPEPMS